MARRLQDAVPGVLKGSWDLVSKVISTLIYWGYKYL